MQKKKKKENLDTDFIPFIRIKSKIDLTLKCQMQIIKRLEYDTGENVGGLGLGNEFVDTIKHVPKCC